MISHKDVSFNCDCSINGDLFEITKTNVDTYLTLKYNDSDYIEIYFIKQNGSGIATIEIDSTLYEKYNLYSSGWITECVYIQNSNTNSYLYILNYDFLLLSLFLKYKWLKILFINIHLEKYFTKNIIILLFLNDCAVYLSVELINDNIINLNINNIIENILLYFGIEVFIYIITGKLSVSSSMIFLFGVVLSIANYYTTILRGTILTPSDLFVIGTAKNVVNNYEFNLNKNICFYKNIGIINIIICFNNILFFNYI